MTIMKVPDLLLYKVRPVQPNSADLSCKAPTPLEPTSPRRRKLSHKHDPFQVSRLVQGAGNVVLSLRDGLSGSERAGKRRLEERKQILAARMVNAVTLHDWETAAIELDQLEENDAWKLDDSSAEADYHPALIRAKLKALDEARTNCDLNKMMYLIRTALSRDIGGMGSVDLYRHSYIGTKALIERYVNSAIQTIRAMVDMSIYQTELDPRELLEEMIYARQSFGRSALLLSGGATFGMAHIGVLKTLFEQQLLPRIISGASAGSIVCAVLCTRKDEEVPSLIRAFPFGDLGVFDGPDESTADHLRSLMTKGYWSDIGHLTRVMRSWLGDVTFQEAYNRTRRVCNICVSSPSIYDVPRLLNYITAPNVLIWSAVAASCSVPLVFKGQPLLMKHPVTGVHEPWIPTPQQLIDGSVDNDLPMTRVAEMFNVNHFIVSQVNPHVVPFLDKDEQVAPGQLHRNQRTPDRCEWLDSLTSLAKEEAMHRMHFLAEMGVFPNLLTKLLSVMSQKYSGDINIIPEISLADLPVMLKNPTPDFMLRNCLIGERATWPKLSRIRDRVAIELELDKAVHALRARVVFSKSQVDLRRAMGVVKPMVYGAGEKRKGRSGTESGDLSPPGVLVVQPPASGEITPSSGERTIRRRRGSGASIQLVAARHRKPFFQDAEDDVSDDDDERLELKICPPRADRAGFRGTDSIAVVAPRLKRNAKSHGHMRAGKPADFQRMTPGGFPWSMKQVATGAEAEDDIAVAVSVPDEDNGVDRVDSPTVDTLTIGIEITPPLESEMAAQGSDGGLMSDADPYGWPGGRGAGTPRKETPSKLRYSEL